MNAAMQSVRSMVGLLGDGYLSCDCSRFCDRRNGLSEPHMSPFGYEGTLRHLGSMSALPLKADTRQRVAASFELMFENHSQYSRGRIACMS